MTDPGEREFLVTFQRGTPTENEYGEQIMSWATLATAYAKIIYGRGDERRAAAQEQANQIATFSVDWNETLAGVIPTDRISFESEAWDIINRSPLGHREIDFEAARAA